MKVIINFDMNNFALLVVHRPEQASESPGGLVKSQMAEYYPESF